MLVGLFNAVKVESVPLKFSHWEHFADDTAGGSRERWPKP